MTSWGRFSWTCLGADVAAGAGGGILASLVILLLYFRPLYSDTIVKLLVAGILTGSIVAAIPSAIKLLILGKRPESVRINIVGLVPFVLAGMLGSALGFAILTANMAPRTSVVELVPLRLAEIAEGQGIFKSKLLGGGGSGGYWRKDVAGLCVQQDSGELIRLISMGLALADYAPVVDMSRHSPRAPLRGYWFRAISIEGEVSADTSHFAVCAFPAVYSDVMNHTFIISDAKRVYFKDLGASKGDIPYPRDPLAAGWTAIK
jgi:hypothetical protein